MHGDPLGKALDELARREASYWQWRIEQCCEAAVQGGEHGVLVRTRNGAPCFVTVDESVPYGQIDYREEGV